MPGRLLVVEDKASLRQMLEHALAAEGYEVAAVDDVAPARERLAAGRFDLVLTDLKLPGGSGLDVLSLAKQADPALAVVVMTAFGTVSAAVEAMKLGAADFLEKPVDLATLFRLVRSLVRGEEPSDLFEVAGVPPIVGRHPRLRAALRLLERVAATETTVLLTGESGTGKELFAHALHGLSPRREGPFVALNCAAIPETLLENELFGHERGAYTGADRRQPGRFELARGGTLFLDEIGELPLAVQAKVLRVLDERTFERVGGGDTIRSDVRVVAATNRDLAGMTAAGAFRTDLLFRLEIFPIELPPLAERRSDIPLLAHHLLRAIAERTRKTPLELAPDAEAFLTEHDWPGNVRQLANLLERAAILAPGPRIGAADLGACLPGAATDPRAAEGDRLREALRATNGDKRLAAERLGVSYRTIVRKVKEFDLEGFPKYRS